MGKVKSGEETIASHNNFVKVEQKKLTEYHKKAIPLRLRA